MENLYYCPVCGWLGLTEEPKTPYGTHEICSCCGIQLGFEVYNESDAKKERTKWIEQGAPWFDEECEPMEWSLELAKKQIEKFLET